jgi:hypothetical protein
MTSNELLDAFKTKFGIETDADLAYVFDVTRPQVADWRAGHRPIPMLIKWRLLDHLGYAWVRDAVLHFVAEDEHRVFKQRDSERMLERAAARKNHTGKKKG